MSVVEAALIKTFPFPLYEEHVKIQHDTRHHLNENGKLVIPMLPLVIKPKTANTIRPSTIPKNYDNSNDIDNSNNKLSKFVNISKRGFKKVIQEVIKFAIPLEHRRIMNIDY